MIALVYVNREQLDYEREMELWRARMIAEGRCAGCEQVVAVAGSILAGMLVCESCSAEWSVFEQAADVGAIGRTLPV